MRVCVCVCVCVEAREEPKGLLLLCNIKVCARPYILLSLLVYVIRALRGCRANRIIKLYIYKLRVKYIYQTTKCTRRHRSNWSFSLLLFYFRPIRTLFPAVPVYNFRTDHTFTAINVLENRPTIHISVKVVLENLWLHPHNRTHI